jgi:hypothetical protein
MKIAFGLLFLSVFSMTAQTADKKPIPFADQWEFIGKAVEESDYHIWCTSPIIADDGKVHLFVSRWKKEFGVDPGWRSQSEIAHYVSDSPEGNFKFKEVVLKGNPQNTWDKYGYHNPLIKKIGEYYALYFIANDNPNQPPHPSNQRIGLVVSKSIDGPWEKVGDDGMILAPSKNPKNWTFKATNGVNNPAVLEHPQGGIFLYFKSNKAMMGLAVADDLKGKYVQMPAPVTKNNTAIEDGYAFMMDSTFCLLTTDNHGILEKGGGILWKSKDGISFDEYESGFHIIEKYVGKEGVKNAKRYYGGNIIKFERPQILFKNGKPAYLYVASGHNIYGGESTVSYVLKFKQN